MTETPLSVLERLRERPDEASWSRLVQMYTPYVERCLRQSGVPVNDAADLAQDVAVTLVRELPGFQHSGRQGAFRKWLRRIVVHRALGYWRRKRRRGTVVQQQQAAAILGELEDYRTRLREQWDAEHDAYVLNRLLEMLEPEFTASTWRAFYEQAIAGRPAAEVAGELGLSVNAVVVAKSRVLQRLRLEASALID